MSDDTLLKVCTSASAQEYVSLFPALPRTLRAFPAMGTSVREWAVVSCGMVVMLAAGAYSGAQASTLAPAEPPICAQARSTCSGSTPSS